MKDLQTIFDRIQENKKKLKDYTQAYKDALKASQQYVEITDELKELKEKKKGIEAAIKEQCASELLAAEDLKIDIASDKELLSDIAMTQIMKGETVAITDQYDNEYEPIFKVNFKKI